MLQGGIEVKTKTDASAIEPLINDLTCEVVTRCQNARRALVKMGPAAVPELVKALNHKNQWVRWEATKALAQIGDSAGTGALIGLLENEEFDMRWMAAEGLIAIGPRSIPKLLKALIENPHSRWLLDGAHHVIHDIRRGDLDKILKPLLNALDDVESSTEIPVLSATALNQMENMYKG
jgi:HEAT repeat protein